MEQHRTESQPRGGTIDLNTKTVTLKYQAVCSCGYVGRVFDSKRDADNDGDEHVLCMCRAGL